MRSRLFIIAALILCSSAHAQSSGNFYSDNYAKTPLEKPVPWGEEAQVAPETPPDSDESEAEEEAEPSEYDRLRDAASERVNPDTAPKPEDIGEEEGEAFELESRPGTPISSLGAIIDGRDTAHFEKSINEFIQVATAHDFTLGKVYFVGPPKSARMEETIGGIAFRGGSIQFRGKVPDQYDVKMSPTWIVATKEGEILLEGVESLARFFNINGEFIDPNTK